MIARERLYLTADKTAAVAAGDRRAAFLYCTPGDEIPESAAERFGLKDGRLKKAGKAKPPKSPKGAAPKAAVDDLTVIKGIGKKTAEALAAGGVTSFADLAAVDPAKPPLLIPGTGEGEWAGWKAAAQEKAGEQKSGPAPDGDKEAAAGGNKEAGKAENKGG